MPLFYSGFVLQMALSVLQKAILCSPNTVVISALDAATKLVMLVNIYCLLDNIVFSTIPFQLYA